MHTYRFHPLAGVPCMRHAPLVPLTLLCAPLHACDLQPESDISDRRESVPIFRISGQTHPDAGPSGTAPAAPRRVVEVPAAAQTDEVESTGDAADDPAIWVHPHEPERSLIIATDKKKGLLVFDLNGKIVQRLDEGRVNNVDLRPGMRFPQGHFDVLAASHRDERSVRFYLIDPVEGRLTPAGRTLLPDEFDEPMGLTMHLDPRTGRHCAFVGDKVGRVAMLLLEPDPGAGHTLMVRSRLARVLQFDSEVEGMVVDDDRGVLYAAEEKVGIWRLPIDPLDSAPPVLIDRVGMGRLVADVEGLAIHRGDDGRGFLIASSQGDSTFAVYDLRDDNPYVFSFRVVGSSAESHADIIDPVDETDGIDAVSQSLGARFPGGLLVVQDGIRPSHHRQNFKLVRWRDIELRWGLMLSNQTPGTPVR